MCPPTGWLVADPRNRKAELSREFLMAHLVEARLSLRVSRMPGARHPCQQQQRGNSKLQRRLSRMQPGPPAGCKVSVVQWPDMLPAMPAVPALPSSPSQDVCFYHGHCATTVSRVARCGAILAACVPR
jgi:hypothetical protein